MEFDFFSAALTICMKVPEERLAVKPTQEEPIAVYRRMRCDSHGADSNVTALTATALEQQ